jgi:hypothetical protein
MSKRSRGSRRRHQDRRQTRRTAIRPNELRAAAPVSQLAAAPEIAEDLIEEAPTRAAEKLVAVADSSPQRRRTTASSLLAAKAAVEYVYVLEDIRRIVLVAGTLLAVLFVLWLVIVPLRLIPIT